MWNIKRVKSIQRNIIFILVTMNQQKIFVNGSKWVEDDEYLQKVKDDISNFKEKVRNSLDQYTKQRLLEAFDAKIMQLKKFYDEKQSILQEELNECRIKCKKEHQKLIRSERQNHSNVDRERITNLNKQLLDKQEKTRQAQERILKLKQQTMKNVTELNLTTKFKEEKQILINQRQQLKQNLNAIKVCLSEDEDKIKKYKLLQEKLKGQIKNLNQNVKTLNNDCQRQRQSAFEERNRLQQDYKRYKDELKSTYQQCRIEQYKRKIREKQLEQSTISNELNRAKFDLAKQRTQIDNLNKQIIQVSSKLRQEKDEKRQLNKLLDERYETIQELQRSSSHQIEHQNLRKSHANVIRDMQIQQDKKIKGIESMLKKNYQDFLKRQKDSIEEVKNKAIDDINQQLKIQKVKNSQLQSSLQEFKQAKRQTLQLHQAQKLSLEYIIDERRQTIKAIAKIFLGFRPQEKDFETVKEKIEEKHNQTQRQLAQLKIKEENLKRQEQSWQKQLLQIKRWLRNTSNLLKSQQVKDIFSKSKRYNTTDEQLQDILNKFSENLSGRLRRDSENLDLLQGEINSLKTQHQNLLEKSENQTNKLKQNLLQKENEQIQLNFQKKQLVKLRKQQEEKFSSAARQIKDKMDRSEKQIKELTERSTKNESEKVSLQKIIDNLQNVKIPELNKRISAYKTNCDKLTEQSNNSEELIVSLQKDLKRIESQKDSLSRQHALNIDQMRKMKQSSSYNENKLADQMTRLKQAMKQSFDIDFSSSDFESILQAIKDNKSSKSLATSTILEYSKAQKNTIINLISSFLKYPTFKTTYLYRYDEFHKNFTNYLPVNQTFDFVVICRLKNGKIFGVISTGMGPGSRALLFNANTGKSFTGDPKTLSTQLDGGSLVFGYGEVRFKNNSNMQFIVNVRAFGTRYFNFKKDEIVGNDDSSVLESMEIYRINP